VIAEKISMKKILKPAFVILTLIAVTSCISNRKYEEEEKSIIEQYISEHSILTEPDANGLYYIEITEGTGEKVEIGDSVGVYYTMKFLSDSIVYSNLEEDDPMRFIVGSVGLIDGWNIGLTYMKGGGKAQLIIPSGLAYGPMGYGYFDYYGRYITVIAGYTPLFYEIEIVEHTKPEK